MNEQLPCKIYFDESKNKVFFNLADGESIEVPKNFQKIMTELALAEEFINLQGKCDEFKAFIDGKNK